MRLLVWNFSLRMSGLQCAFTGDSTREPTVWQQRRDHWLVSSPMKSRYTAVPQPRKATSLKVWHPEVVFICVAKGVRMLGRTSLLFSPALAWFCSSLLMEDLLRNSCWRWAYMYSRRFLHQSPTVFRHPEMIQVREGNVRYFLRQTGSGAAAGPKLFHC